MWWWISFKKLTSSTFYCPRNIMSVPAISFLLSPSFTIYIYIYIYNFYRSTYLYTTRTYIYFIWVCICICFILLEIPLFNLYSLKLTKSHYVRLPHLLTILLFKLVLHIYLADYALSTLAHSLYCQLYNELRWFNFKSISQFDRKKWF